MRKAHPHIAKPNWLRKRLPDGAACESVRQLIREGRLHTVCQEAQCPNIWECFARRTATFLILGNRCTRDCGFCAVIHGQPDPPDPEEPARVAAAAERMQLDYVVVTSVTRDDLPDYGARHFFDTVRALRKHRSGIRVEVLIPDMMGDPRAVQVVLDAVPDVVNHNMETVPRLYPRVRPSASYRRSLAVLEEIRTHSPKQATKSGLMLGLGESEQEITETLRDLHAAGCRILTLGQYLQPTRQHLPVVRYVSPAEFSQWRTEALAMGFAAVASGPFVRSSFQAKEVFHATL